jgi:predicted nucleic acid-binding protein
MIVVADTSPLNYLLLIGKIEILPQLYGKVAIPPAVRDELLNERTPDSVKGWFAGAPAWLEELKLSGVTEPALNSLGRGEREAIALALEIDADRIVLDDEDARLAASSRNIPVIGTLGILREGARAGLLDLASSIRLLQQTTFHAAPWLIQRVLDEETARTKQSS